MHKEPSSGSSQTASARSGPMWGIGRWMLAQPGAALAILGVLIYVLISVGYAEVYRPFGVDAKELGVDLSEVIFRAGVSTLLSILGLAALSLVFVVFLNLTLDWGRRVLLPKLSHRWKVAGTREAETPTSSKFDAWDLLWLCLFIGAVVTWCVLSICTIQDNIRAGEAVKPGYETFPRVRADPVLVEWIGEPGRR